MFWTAFWEGSLHLLYIGLHWHALCISLYKVKVFFDIFQILFLGDQIKTSTNVSAILELINNSYKSRTQRYKRPGIME